jgi:hypothetical protein
VLFFFSAQPPKMPKSQPTPAPSSGKPEPAKAAKASDKEKPGKGKASQPPDAKTDGKSAAGQNGDSRQPQCNQCVINISEAQDFFAKEEKTKVRETGWRTFGEFSDFRDFCFHFSER